MQHVFCTHTFSPDGEHNLSVRPYFPPERVIAHCLFSLGCGGAERNLVRQLRALYSAGYQNLHVVISEFTDSADLYYQQDIAGFAAVHYADDTSGQLPHHAPMLIRLLPHRFRRNILAYYNILKHVTPDVVHVWSDNPYALCAAILLPIRRVIINWRNMPPNVFHTMGTRSWRLWPKTWLDNTLFKVALRNPAVRLVCVCRAGASAYEKVLGLPDESVATVYNGVDPALWQRATDEEVANLKHRLGIPSEGKVVVGLMRFDVTKRPQLFFDTAALVCKQTDEPITFVLFGDGPLRGSMLEQAKALGIICPGVIREVSVGLSMADLLLHTSSAEGLPNALVEAGLMGVPIVSTTAGGTPETVIDGITARLIPEQPNMAQAMANILLQTLQDTTFMERAREEAPHFVQERFSPERTLQQTLALYS